MSEKTDKSKLKKLKHVKVYDQLYEQIKNGTYPPEAQLPPETTLAASMNVSRMTLRKALLLLIEDGLIKNVPGVGNFVRSARTSLPASVGTVSGKTVPLHPMYAYCTDSLDHVELDSRIEVPSESMISSSLWNSWNIPAMMKAIIFTAAVPIPLPGILPRKTINSPAKILSCWFLRISMTRIISCS